MRRATEADIPHLCDLGAKFHKAAKLPGAFNRNVWADFIRSVWDQDGVFFVTDGGMIGAIPATQPWTDNYWTASEICWWSEDGRGLELLDAFEAWAAQYDEIHMMFLETLRPVAVMRLLQQRGYVKGQTMMVKKCPS